MPSFKKSVKAVTIALLVIVAFLAILAFIGSNGDNEESDTGNVEPPEYTVVAEEDLSYSAIMRWQVRAQTTGGISKEEIDALARDIVDCVKSEREVNAISIFLYRYGDDANSTYTIASIDYAPYGEWSRAGEVETGDYSSHEYDIEYA